MVGRSFHSGELSLVDVIPQDWRGIDPVHDWEFASSVSEAVAPRERFREVWPKNEGLLKSLCEMISTIIVQTLKAGFWLLEAVYSYLVSDGYNVLDFIYLIITISTIFSWISIVSITNTLDFTQSVDKKGVGGEETTDNVQLLAKLRDNYNFYFFYQSINGFILFLRLLGVFKFSQSINNMMTVIYRAKRLVFFHSFSMVFFNLGFCFAGYALFSQNVKEFSTLPLAFLQVLNIVVGNVNLDYFQNDNMIIAAIFIVFITFSNYLILLNILLSIVVHTFFDIKNENKINFGNDIDEDFITKISVIIYKKNLLIFTRIEVYFYNVFHYLNVVDEKILHFNNEISERRSKIEKKEEEDNKKSYTDETKKSSDNEVILTHYFINYYYKLS